MRFEGGEFGSRRRKEYREYDEMEDRRREVEDLLDELKRKWSDEARERQEHAEGDEYEREAPDLIDETQEERRREQYWREETEDCIREAMQDIEREKKAERKACEEAEETIESEVQEAANERDKVDSKELDERNDFDKEESIENDLGQDINEVRDGLHDRFVNDMERQLEGASTKVSEVDETGSEGSSSEMTESSESYHDAGGGMAYATRTERASGEVEAVETETGEETQEVSEPETQEPTEAEPVNERSTNKIIHTESEEGETAASSETQETCEYNDARTSPEISEPEEEAQEISEGHEKAEPAVSSEKNIDMNELSDEVEERELSETSESNVENEELEQEIDEFLESIEEAESCDEEVDEKTVEHGEFQQEMSEDSEAETEKAEANEGHAEDEPLPESLDEFVERVKDLLDEHTEEDDRYDYVQDPLTGEIQRVPKILAGYESDGERRRRKHRNLFAELSEKERERFKELVCEEERSAEEVEQEWNRVVEQAERERQKLLEQVREILEEPDIMQILESVSEEDKKGHTNIESVEDNEMDEDESTEEFLTQGETRLKLWIPRVNGGRVESVEELEQLVKEQYPGLMKHKDYSKYLRQAKLHLELMQRFQDEDLNRGDIAQIAKETGESPVTLKRWLIEGAKPRVYHYLNRNPLEDRAERVARLLSSLNGVTDMESLEKRLRTLFLYSALEQSKKHTENLERARLFFQFLEEYAQGGILKSIAKRMKIGKSTISEWFGGSQLPSYVRLAVEIPNDQLDTGKKWLPLRLNSRTNLPEQFIQVPESVTSEEDLLSVLQQLQSLDTPQMKEFEEEYGKEHAPLTFMYLLGLIVSDGGFDSDSDLSARVVLSASKKYRWSLRLGKAFSYAMGRIAMKVERRADDINYRDGKTTIFHVWGSQASPLLRWIKEELLGLGRSHLKKELPVDADWILKMPSDYRIAFLQGLADGDGYASIKAFCLGIASKPNREFIKRLLASLDIHSNLKSTKVVINRQEDILKMKKFPLFRHATSRKRFHNELCKIIGLLDRSYGKAPEKERKIIVDLHKQGFTPGEITEKLWFEHSIARSTSSVEGIVRRHKRNQTP
jgi:hypothetical protein